jgi:predicted nucleic acid-binding protein
VNVALDTNILAYAEGLNDAKRQRAAIELVSRLAPESTFLPIQALGELFAILVKKGGRPRDQARQAILHWGDTFPLIESSSDVVLRAMDLANDHQMFVWDAFILSSAAEANCRLLLSEDLQDGFTWGGVTVTNPFAAERHPLLIKAVT